MRQAQVWVALTVVVGLGGCVDRSPTSLAISAAASTSDVTVTATDPDSATQDTTLDVVVTGTNFDRGSTAEWAIDGVPSAKVRINSTEFVNSKRLVANITIAADADTALYDVIVMTSSGKKGIGTELFAVKKKLEPIPLTAVLRDDPADGVASDASLRAGLDPKYSDGVDGAGVQIMENGNFNLDVRSPSTRQFCLDFHGQPGAPYTQVCDDGYITTGNPSVEGGFRAMPAGTQMTTRLQVTWVKDGYNWFLRFGRDCQEQEVPEKWVTVTRSADGGSWTVDTPATTAVLCRVPTKGRPGSEFVGEFLMPFQLVLQIK